MVKSRLSEAQRLARWQAEHDRFTQSGLSVKQWCLSEGIAKSAFYMRRSCLKLNSSKLKVAAVELALKRTKVITTRPTFIDAGVCNAKPSTTSSASMISSDNQTSAEVHIDLGGGVVITVRRMSHLQLSDAR